jgi:hypothetical protein
MGDPPGGGDSPHCSEQVPRIQGSLLQWVLAKEVHGQRDKVVQTHLLPDEKPQIIGLEVSDRQDPQSMGSLHHGGGVLGRATPGAVEILD